MFSIALHNRHENRDPVSGVQSATFSPNSTSGNGAPVSETPKPQPQVPSFQSVSEPSYRHVEKAREMSGQWRGRHIDRLKRHREPEKKTDGEKRQFASPRPSRRWSRRLQVMQTEGSASEPAYERDLAAVGSMRSSPPAFRRRSRQRCDWGCACRPSSWVPTGETTLDEENRRCKGGGRSYELIVLLDSIILAFSLAKTRLHSGDRAYIRLKIAIGRP
jgi:hypothetical protein